MKGTLKISILDFESSEWKFYTKTEYNKILAKAMEFQQFNQWAIIEITIKSQL